MPKNIAHNNHKTEEHTQQHARTHLAKYGHNTKTPILAKCGQNFKTQILARCGHENQLAKCVFFWPNAVMTESAASLLDWFGALRMATHSEV